MNYLFFFLCLGTTALGAQEALPAFEERNGLLAVEAEDFHAQTLHETRSWQLVHAKGPERNVDPERNLADPDEPHVAKASGRAYLELLPDTRTTHDDPLIRGTNFTNTPGEMAVLTYRVYINSPGKYYVWVRAYSTGTEDNGLHVGLDGSWPESGQRMQWCEGKHQWTWASKQRTQEEHCGLPELIYLTIEEAGYHDIHFSMREDGFEFDKWVLNQRYEMPTGKGPKPRKKKSRARQK